MSNASTTGKRVNTLSSAFTSGRCPSSPSGSAFQSDNMVMTPKIAISAKDILQPIFCPIHVANGTPPILAMVSPINIIATALACLSFGTTLMATIEPIPKNAPWFKLVKIRAPIKPQ